MELPATQRNTNELSLSSNISSRLSIPIPKSTINTISKRKREESDPEDGVAHPNTNTLIKRRKFKRIKRSSKPRQYGSASTDPLIRSYEEYLQKQRMKRRQILKLDDTAEFHGCVETNICREKKTDEKPAQITTHKLIRVKSCCGKRIYDEREDEQIMAYGLVRTDAFCGEGSWEEYLRKPIDLRSAHKIYINTCCGKRRWDEYSRSKRSRR